jgi:ATP-dependent helicase HrpB
MDRALPFAEKETQSFLARVRSLRAWIPELDLPAFEKDEIAKLLPELCDGARSFDELKRRDLPAFLRTKLSHEQQRALDREAPERLQVPSGSWITLEYEPGRSPVLAARIQELFGLADTPRIARGRIGVVMHLLAPNYRPQQVTNDLKSFWSNAYFEVRKELKRRYPKHSWPEDPWNAVAERKPKRRS